MVLYSYRNPVICITRKIRQTRENNNNNMAYPWVSVIHLIPNGSSGDKSSLLKYYGKWYNHYCGNIYIQYPLVVLCQAKNSHRRKPSIKFVCRFSISFLKCPQTFTLRYICIYRLCKIWGLPFLTMTSVNIQGTVSAVAFAIAWPEYMREHLSRNSHLHHQVG